jgi:hypothetical protein
MTPFVMIPTVPPPQDGSSAFVGFAGTVIVMSCSAIVDRLPGSYWYASLSVGIGNSPVV